MNSPLMNMDIPELTALSRAVSAALAEKTRRNQARQRLDALVREMGFSSISEIIGAPVQRRRAAERKFANPADKTMTWSGRGKQPAWVREALDRGLSMDALRIQTPPPQE